MKVGEEKNGIVTETLADLRFRIKLDDGEEVIAYMAGKMKFRRINVFIGDRVRILIDPAGGKATNRITWRY